MTDDVDSPSLDSAMTSFGVPGENRAFVRRLEPVIPLVRFVRTSGYIRADRADGGPSLRIAYGWTSGFVSEEEILTIFGDVDRWPSERQGLWGIWHPENRAGHGGGGPAGPPDRTYGVCSRCNMTLPATGECDTCGD